jgi:glycosyltransferase involved in cell wall biosynthesis
MKDILLIIPVYNEEKNIEKVCEEIKDNLSFVDILVVNDCSTDNTLQVIKKILCINYISLPFNLGYSGALQTGFKYAFDKEYKYVIQFDGDGQHIASEANKMYQILLEKKADIVIGSRFKSSLTNYEHSFFRMLGTRIFCYLIKISCKTEISDPTSGFQILSRDVFSKYAKMYNYPEYPDANLLIDMLLQNYKIEEIHVEMRKREYGVSMHSGILKPTKYMVKMFYSILLVLMNDVKFIQPKKMKS